MKFAPPGDIRNRIDDISKQFTGTGWKHLPQELVDEILGYLADDLCALKAYSLTCKPLFAATRPFIHRRVHVASSLSWIERPKPKGTLFILRKEDPEALEQLVNADRSGLLYYIRSLTFKMDASSFNPGNIYKYLPHLRSMNNLLSLTLVPFHTPPTIPIFSEYYDIFANPIQHPDTRNAPVTDQQLLYIVSHFPMLEDLTIVSPTMSVARPERPFPAIKQSPPLRGTLVLVEAHSRRSPDGLVALPGGLNCRSLELHRCKDPQAVLDACGHSVTSVSCSWGLWSIWSIVGGGESNS